MDVSYMPKSILLPESLIGQTKRRKSWAWSSFLVIKPFAGQLESASTLLLPIAVFVTRAFLVATRSLGVYPCVPAHVTEYTEATPTAFKSAYKGYKHGQTLEKWHDGDGYSRFSPV